MINIISSYVIQFCVMLTPFIVLPLISRGLIKDEFDSFLVLQSFCIWASTLVEYGYNITAPKLVQKNRENVSIILFSKFFLGLVTFIISSFTLAFLGLSPLESFLGSVYTILLGGNFYWYFLSVNELKISSKYETVSSVVTISSFLILAKIGTLTLSICLATLCFGRGIPLILSLITILKMEHIQRPSIAQVKNNIADATHSFIFRVGGSLYTVANGIILNFAQGTNFASQYLQAERLVKACFMGAIIPLNNGLYTKVLSKTVNKLKYIIFVTVISLFLCIGLYLLKGELIYYFYGTVNYEVEKYFSLFLIILPVISIINTFNYLYIFPNRLEHYSSIVMLMVGIVNIITAFPIINTYGVTGFIYLNIAMEIMVLGLIYIIYKVKA